MKKNKGWGMWEGEAGKKSSGLESLGVRVHTRWLREGILIKQVEEGVGGWRMTFMAPNFFWTV